MDNHGYKHRCTADIEKPGQPPPLVNDWQRRDHTANHAQGPTDEWQERTSVTVAVIPVWQHDIPNGHEAEHRNQDDGNYTE